MTTGEFYFLHLLPHLGDFFTILSLVFCVYFFAFKRQVYSLFDPLVLFLFFSAFGATDVIFMYRRKLISDYYFSSYILTQIAFSIGLIIIKPINLQALKNKQNKGDYYRYHKKGNLLYIKLFFTISSVICIMSHLATYIFLGIPLFLQSRLDLFADSGGFSVLQRFNQITPIIVIFLGAHLALFSQKKTMKFFIYLSILAVIIFSFLSGSKSTFIVIVFASFYYWLWSLKLGYKLSNTKLLLKLAKYRQRIKKYQVVCFVAALISTLAVLMITRGEQVNLLASLFRSLVNRGDVYIYAYPNGVIERLEQVNPLLAIFRGPLGKIGLFDSKDLPDYLGIELFRYHFRDIDVRLGPNPRHNVFGLLYFGYYASILYSFVLGITLGFIRNRLFYLVPSTVMGGLIYTLSALIFSGLENDVTLVVAKVLNAFLVLSFIAVIVYLLSSPSLIKRTN